MAGLLPDLRISPYIKPYQGGINEEFGAVLNKKISDYDIAKANDDMLAYQAAKLRNAVAPFEKDREAAIGLFNRYLGRINERADKGNYEDFIQDTSRDARVFQGEIEPILDNYRLYQDWRKSMNDELEKGNITKRTHDATINYMHQNYKGLDLNNIPGTRFQPFHPGKHYNITDFVNRVGNDWESQKIGGYVQIGDKVFQKTTDTLPPEILLKGFQHFIASNPEYQSYKQGQGIIGLGDIANQEEMNALIAGVNKYSKNNITEHFDEGYNKALRSDRDRLDFLNRIGVTTDQATVNPKVLNEFAGLNLDSNGKFSINNEYVEKRGDKYVKYFDKDGTPITVKQATNRKLDQSQYSTKDLGITSKELTEGELAQHRQAADNRINGIIMNAYERYNTMKNDGTLPENAIDDSFFFDPKNRKFFLDSYNKAVANAETFANAQKIDNYGGSKVGGIDNYIAENLEGRRLNINSTSLKEAGVKSLDNEKGVDINAFRDALSKDNWKIIKEEGTGIKGFNAFSPDPAVSVRLTLRNEKTKAEKTINLSADMTPDDPGYHDFKVMNDVMSLATTGQSGNVDLGGGQQFRVTSSIPFLQGEDRFKTKVERIVNGQVVESVSPDTFVRYYTDLIKQRAALDNDNGFLETVFGKSKTTNVSSSTSF